LWTVCVALSFFQYIFKIPPNLPFPKGGVKWYGSPLRKREVRGI
jgi:hypothetical protein